MSAVVVADGARVLVVDLERNSVTAQESLAPDPTRAAEAWLDGRRVPAGLLARTEGGWVSDERRRPLLRRASPAEPATLAQLRAGRGVAVVSPRAERPFRLAVARLAAERALRAPEEVLISLAREEERLERAIGREHRAAEAFVAPPGTLLAEYTPAWDLEREALDRHHRRLVDLLERAARTTAPNLSELLGPRVAARLIAAAGSLVNLGRMSAARLQLLGARRRPSAERGPRYGVVYRAARMADVPPGRRGAFARSLAALSVVAARADAWTHRSLGESLVRRRDRRLEQLRRSH